MATQSASLGSSSTPTDFNAERDKLIAEIAENLAKCVTSVNQLNRNIENVALVGSGFQQVNSLWKQFENAMSPQPIVPNQQEEGEEKTTVFLPQRTNTVGEDVEVLVPGAAPGAGAPGIELNPNTKPQ